MKKIFSLINGDARHIPLKNNSVQMVATSPPYFGLRDYGEDNQIGLEKSVSDYVSNIVLVFREAKRVLKNDGIVFLNLGDSYSGSGRGWRVETKGSKYEYPAQVMHDKKDMCKELPRKNLLGIPWRVAFALQDDGWYLRQDIIWSKPNPMPESVKDRCTKSHEYIFLLSKSDKYFYDHEAVKVPSKGERGKSWEERKSAGMPSRHGKLSSAYFGDSDFKTEILRNRHSVWSVPTVPYSGAHFASWPPDLVEPMIKAGSREGDIILDPFCGSGVTGIVSRHHGRQFVGMDLSMTYLQECAKERTGLRQLDNFFNGIPDKQSVDFGLFARATP